MRTVDFCTARWLVHDIQRAHHARRRCLSSPRLPLKTYCFSSAVASFSSSASSPLSHLNALTVFDFTILGQCARPYCRFVNGSCVSTLTLHGTWPSTYGRNVCINLQNIFSNWPNANVCQMHKTRRDSNAFILITSKIVSVFFSFS